MSAQLAMSSLVQGKTILDIWSEINTGNDRPSPARNSYRNMVWWLNKYFQSYSFSVTECRNTDDAMLQVVQKINSGFPVMVSTNHSRTSGHIILVVGYRNYQPLQSSMVEFICHDPYGKFNPQLGSSQYGANRYSGGQSLMSGDQTGPGKAVIYDHNGIRRMRSDRHSVGVYYLISG